jgi:hypothetical protein
VAKCRRLSCCAASQTCCQTEDKGASEMILAYETSATTRAIEFPTTVCTHPPQLNGQTCPISRSLYVCVCYTTCAGRGATLTRVLLRICHPPDLKCRRMGVCHGMARVNGAVCPDGAEPTCRKRVDSCSATALAFRAACGLRLWTWKCLFLGLPLVAVTKVKHAD